MSSIFISRQLSKDSILLHDFPRESFNWTDHSLIRFTPVHFDLPSTSWLFFYSPRGVQYFGSGLAHKRLIENYKCGCFGGGTANAFVDIFGEKPDFTGTGEKKTTAQLFCQVAESEAVTFVSGRRSLRSLQTLIGQDLDYREISVYNNSIVEKAELETYSAAILTSPMNVEGFMIHGGHAKHMIAIGQSTKFKLDQYGLPSQVAEQPSERAISKCLKVIFDQ